MTNEKRNGNQPWTVGYTRNGKNCTTYHNSEQDADRFVAKLKTEGILSPTKSKTPLPKTKKDIDSLNLSLVYHR